MKYCLSITLIIGVGKLQALASSKVSYLPSLPNDPKANGKSRCSAIYGKHETTHLAMR